MPAWAIQHLGFVGFRDLGLGGCRISTPKNSALNPKPQDPRPKTQSALPGRAREAVGPNYQIMTIITIMVTITTIIRISSTTIMGNQVKQKMESSMEAT